jgi:hypothetical protein
MMDVEEFVSFGSDIKEVLVEDSVVCEVSVTR